jgi:uncharacterized lipoprotein YbaY
LRPLHPIAALAVAFAMLAGCAAPPPPSAATRMPSAPPAAGGTAPKPAPAARAAAGPSAIEGELTHRARIAIGPEALAIVELRREGDGGASAVVAEWREATRGRQVPIPFRLVVDAAAWQPGARYVLRGAILDAGRPAWASEPVVIDAAAVPARLPPLVLASVPALAFTTEFRCGLRRVVIGVPPGAPPPAAGGGLVMLVHGVEGASGAGRTGSAPDRFDLVATPTASGARHVAAGDPGTSIWNQGAAAIVEVRGAALPPCVKLERE